MHSKERLQLIVTHERSLQTDKQPDYLPSLRRDLLQVIAKYISINTENVQFQVENQSVLEVLEITIDMSKK